MALQGRRTTNGEGEISRRRVQTEANFTKCTNAGCSATLFIKEVEANFNCCPKCGQHFRIGSRRRVEITLDPGSWVEMFDNISSVDPLKFTGKRSYAERITESQAKTGLQDAVICGEGAIEGRPLVFCAMDFKFMGGSMGSVVGEKITRAIEHATARRWPVAVVCCSGGARMDEGVLSLMQMAKTSAAIERHYSAGLPYFTILTDPTLAGVSASFAFLADVIIAEPKAMIGFTGARVIQDTIKVKLPVGFQEAEFLLKHGQVDRVVPREEIRATLGRLLSYWSFGRGDGALGTDDAERLSPAEATALDLTPVPVAMASGDENEAKANGPGGASRTRKRTTQRTRRSTRTRKSQKEGGAEHS